MLLPNIDFSKTIVFGDLHLGLKNNSREHNAKCEEFIIWMIEQAKIWNTKTCIFVGDWHHIRSAVNVSTLNYSVSCLKLLNDYFSNIIFLLGNHDVFYRDKLEIHSIPYINEFKNIHLIDSITIKDDIAFIPWLVGDEWKRIQNITQPYMFGHFELPTFKMNASIEMQDNGLLKMEHFVNQKQVFSGHFHKRQNKGKIWYIGNCFPHDFSDIFDEENRGIMYWQPGKEPKFKYFPNTPKYKILQLSEVLDNPYQYIDNNTYAKIHLDVNIEYEDSNFLKEIFESELQCKSINFITKRIDEIEVDSNVAINFESVDSIVISHLQSIESNTLSKQYLINIYESL
jgi:DNA repair exonuclease SbcCD nuclease subunit